MNFNVIKESDSKSTEQTFGTILKSINTSKFRLIKSGLSWDNFEDIEKDIGYLSSTIWSLFVLSLGSNKTTEVEESLAHLHEQFDRLTSDFKKNFKELESITSKLDD